MNCSSRTGVQFDEIGNLFISHIKRISVYLESDKLLTITISNEKINIRFSILYFFIFIFSGSISD